MTESAPRFRCRSCDSIRVSDFLSLGSMPLSDAFRTLEELDEPEPRFPLDAAFCQDCSLVQITETVPPEQLFGERYVYHSSFSRELLQHARRNVERQIASLSLGEHSQVVEVASNDGYLLQYYRKRGIPVLGIDPAPSQAKAAAVRGIPTLREFFGFDLATRLHDDGIQADVVHGNNVLAHVADTNGFVAGIEKILKDEGVAVLEFPYVRDLIEDCEFDTIYHEHLCYFSVHSLVSLLSRHHLALIDIEHLSIHGGSLRVYVAKSGSRRSAAVQDSVSRFLECENNEGMNGLNYYSSLADRVEALKANLRLLLDSYKNRGKRLAGYGAAAKGTILLNYVGIDSDYLDFMVDRNTHKHGRYMPGVEILITGPETLLEHQPFATLILPWNFAREILAQQTEYRQRGGLFIIPVPVPRVV